MKRFTLSCGILLAALLFVQARPTGHEEARLTRATITFITHNDDKAPGTRIRVAVKSKQNLFLCRSLARAENVGGNMEFADPSRHTFDLALCAGGTRSGDIKVPVVAIDIQPDGNDGWFFDYTVTLQFDNGTSFTSRPRAVLLDQDNKHYEGVVAK